MSFSIGSIMSGAGALVSGASSAMGGFGSMAYDYWKYKDSQDYNQWMYENRHQMEVGDLKAAGLNPILSAMGSPGSYAGSSAGAVINPMENVTRDWSTAKRALKEMELVDKQISLVDEQARKTSLEADVLKPKAALGDAIGDVAKSVLDPVSAIASSAVQKSKGFFAPFLPQHSAASFKPMSDAERRNMDDYISNASMVNEPRRSSRSFILNKASGRYESAPDYYGPRSRGGR